METLCRAVMDRGRFPYAHIDLHLGDGGACHVSEITLDGGITGAIINRAELNRRKQAALERMAEER
jgi:ribosomal protein S6--L-glutamate ligase